MKKYQIIFLILALVATVFIFRNSLKTAEESVAQSNVVVLMVKPDADLEHSEALYFDLIRGIRKCAHVLEFFVLGFFWGGVFFPGAKRMMQGVNRVLLVGVATACCDELLQMFTEGRSAGVGDVLIDCSGVVVACLFWAILMHFKRGSEDNGHVS